MRGQYEAPIDTETCRSCRYRRGLHAFRFAVRFHAKLFRQADALEIDRAGVPVELTTI